MDFQAAISRLSTMARFQIQLLGPFAVQRGGEELEVERWARPAQSLLKLVALAEGHQLRREELIDLLWPDSTPEAGASNLRHNLHVLRRQMGGDEGDTPILSERGWVRLNPTHVWDIDADRLLAAAESDDLRELEEVARIYRGEPLIEDRYDQWAEPAREHLQRIWHTICLRLSRWALETGTIDRAVAWAERALESDPLDEEGVRELLRALEATGKRSEALRRYGEFERLLMTELRVAPSVETDALVAGLREQATAVTDEDELPGGAEPLPARYLGAPPLDRMVARDEEIARIETVMETVEAGAGRLLVVTGEEGVGKTRLAQEVAQLATARGYGVLFGRCHAARSTVPLLPFREILESMARLARDSGSHEVLVRQPELESLLNESERSSNAGHGEMRRLNRALTDVLSVLADAHPLAVLLDDLQWMDVASLEVFADLVRSTQTKAILLLATYQEAAVERTSPLGRTMRELDREGIVAWIPLRRLTEEGTAAMIAATIGDVATPAEFAVFVHRRTKGNPFYIGRMLRGLGGRYRMVRQIGAGGMGRVFEAVDTETDDHIALKLMFARTEAEPRALLRFEQEGAVLASMDHPNIVRVQGTFSEEHASCIVMELLDGPSLRRILQSGPLELARIKTIACQVAAALACAHDRGIAHRDIKPDNIMVVAGDRVKVTDFGVARLVRSQTNAATMTSTGMIIGTPLYMSPEQIEGKVLDGRTDIYSLGAVLYEMVTGRPPFTGEDSLGVAIQHVRAEPPAPTALAPDLPPDWERLILKALAKDPTDRFATAEAMGRAIRELGDIPGTGGTGIIRRRERRRWMGKRRSAWFVAVAALLAVTLTVVAYATRSTSAQKRSLGRLVASWTVPSSPVALTVDRQGVVYVGTDGEGIPRYSSGGRLLGGMTLHDALRDPYLEIGGLAVDGSRNLYATEFDLSLVVELSHAGQQRAVWSTAQSSYTDIQGIAVTRQGTAFVADQTNGAIDDLRSPGADVTSRTIPERHTAFDPYPYGIALDNHNDLYVTDALNAVLIKLSPQGVLLGQWGSRGSGPDQFRSPEGVAVAPDGTVYVADAGNNRVQILSASGAFLASVTGPNGHAARFSRPAAIAVDGHGDVYVADTGHGRIDRFVPAVP